MRKTEIGLLVALGVSGSALVGHSMGGSVAIMLASRRPDLVSRLVVAEANLDPGMGPVSASILAHTEEAYVARAGATGLASPVAMYRSARSLTLERRPSFHELLLETDAPRTSLVGSRTLEMDEKSVSGESGGGLAGTPVERVVVPDAGHMTIDDNVDAVARIVARALA